MKDKLTVNSPLKDFSEFVRIPERRKSVINQALPTPVKRNYVVNSNANFATNLSVFQFAKFLFYFHKGLLYFAVAFAINIVIKETILPAFFCNYIITRNINTSYW